MANRRMFSLDVVNTDKFLDMPVTAQCLYFHFGMRADDDGFISSPKQIMRMASCTQEDIKILVQSGFIIPFESGIIVIRHWKQHNYIQSDRYKRTEYIEEREHLKLDGNVYSLNTECIQDISEADTQGRLGKVRDSIELVDTLRPEPDKPAPDPSGIKLILNDKSFYEVSLSDIQLWRDTYPAVNIENELKRMAAWLDSNPARKKTRRGIKRFINSWLSRAQDGERGRGGQQEPEHGQGCYSSEIPDEVKELIKRRGERPDDPFK